MPNKPLFQQVRFTVQSTLATVRNRLTKVRAQAQPQTNSYCHTSEAEDYSRQPEMN
ncbi:hypothetical protein E8E14_003204 [Neopestalotiopsis sp. 37M]|nr:hypothetical protein E8E14_003204 [Neopestalotiopsis sp. 37M]